jgi:hypothetical protein
MWKRSTSPPLSNSGVDNKSTSGLSQWPLLVSSPLLEGKDNNGGRVQTSMMSGTGWAGGPNLLISISGQLLVINGIVWVLEQVQKTESSSEVSAAMTASRCLSTTCIACCSLPSTLEISCTCDRTKLVVGTMGGGSLRGSDWSFCVAKYA